MRKIILLLLFLLLFQSINITQVNDELSCYMYEYVPFESSLLGDSLNTQDTQTLEFTINHLCTNNSDDGSETPKIILYL